VDLSGKKKKKKVCVDQKGNSAREQRNEKRGKSGNPKRKNVCGAESSKKEVYGRAVRKKRGTKEKRKCLVKRGGRDRGNSPKFRRHWEKRENSSSAA